jgi:hypothetical protein
VNREELAQASAERTAEARAHLMRALAEPTLEKALATFGRRYDSFWRAVKRHGLEDETRLRYGAPKGVRNTENERPLADVVEDAQFLAMTGETREGAAKRLGFNSWDSLYSRLSNNGHEDIVNRFIANEDRARVPQGTYRNSLSNRRPAWSR